MKKQLYTTVLATVLTAWFCPGTARADAIKDRMIARVPVINELLQKGVVGENNAGILVFRGDSKEKADIISAENADRQEVYESIAKTQGTSAQLVGQRRAAQIAERAKPGTWLQDKSGKWYQK